MNLLIYLVLTLVLLTTLGLPKDEATTTVGTVSKCVVAASTPADKIPACVTPNSPAAKAGLQPGDVITAIGRTPIRTWDDAVAVIEKSSNRPLAVAVQRDGAPVTLTITPVTNEKCFSPSDCTRTREAGFIGVSPYERRYFDAVPILDVPGEIGSQIATGWSHLLQYPERIADLWGTVFDGKERDPNSAIGVVGIGRISGDFAQSELLNVQDKIFLLVSLLASVNLLLFFFNLLPLLPLDGGHVAGALVEAAKRGYARLRGRARHNIFVDTAQMLPVMYGVASVLILLTLLTLYADIVDPVRLVNG